MVSSDTPPLTPPRRNNFLIHIASPALLTFVLCLGLIFVVIIPAMRRTIIDRKKEMIRELTQTAWSELASLQEQERNGALSRDEAQQTAIARIQRLRYGDDAKDYFWITDEHPRMVMHPYRPELNGQDLSIYADPAGRKLFVDFSNLVRMHGEGYTDYLWQWKDDEHRVAPKLSYIKGFAPWGWIIGTGIYLDDVHAEIDRVTRRVLLISMAISAIIALLLGYLAHQGLQLERRRGRAENALRTSEEKYRLLVEGTTEGVLMVLADRPVYANKTLLDRLGYTETELADLPLARILDPVSPPHARLISRNGTTTDVLLTIVPVTINGQTGQVLSLKDVTSHKQTEETLQRLLTELNTTLPMATRPIRAASLSLATCELDSTIQQAAVTMTRARASAILVKAPGGETVGIVTDHDLRDRVLAVGLDASRPVSQIMSAPLIRIPDHAFLFEAARVMQERNLQHLVVTDERGGTLGVLAGTEILHAQRHAVGLLLAEISRSSTSRELQDHLAKLPILIRSLLDGGTRVEHITRILSNVSDAATVQLLRFAEAELGPPPAPYAFVALGSVARGEQTLATDQDNALIYADGVEAGDYFLSLGEKVCAGLAQAGYRRCKGETMACNPKWCQPLERWRQYFTDCIRHANPQDLLDANIFFDFRCIHGEASYITCLREHLRQRMDPPPAIFLFHLAQKTMQFKPPRGFFGNIQVESGGEHPDTFNIKSAIIPLVNFARVYALRHQVMETNTLERLSRLRNMGVLRPSSHDELLQAYTTLMQMRLTHQAAQLARHAAPDNHVNLAELTQLERSVLRKVFADITVFQARIEADFTRTS